MNVLFLIYHGLDAASGISKKIIAQVEGLRQNGHKVHLCTYDVREDGHRCRFVDGEVISDFGSGKLAALRKRCSYADVYRYCVKNDIQAVYVRSFHNANPWTIRLFRRLRKAGIPSVMEIPTYPYDAEYRGFPIKERLELKIDQIFRYRLAAQMSGIVTFSDVDPIFGTRSIKIGNGIDFDAIPLRTPKRHADNELHLLGVAEVHYWHAYDRMIKGIAEYYAKNPNPDVKVIFHIVGGVCDDDLLPWTAFTKEQRIEPYVVFHGRQSGDSLNCSFDNADFAIGSLGRHRSGIDKIKTLKNREYAARGMSFIYSETDEDFEHQPYILKAPADETPISVESIIEFLRSQRITPEAIRVSVKYCSWKEQMRKVMSAL